MNEVKKCVVCDFSDNQEDIVETPDGYAHRECLEDQQTKYFPGLQGSEAQENET